MPAEQGLLVEFAGLPAAGKSRLAEETRDHLSRSGIGASGAPRPTVTTSSGKREGSRRALAAARLILTQPVGSPMDTVASARAHIQSGQQNALKTLRFFLYYLYLRAEIHGAKRAHEIYLADQGLLQHLRRVHLTATADGIGYLRTLAKTCYPPLAPDLVVFVDVDHRTRMERARQRGTEVDDELFDPAHPAIQADLESYRDLKALVSDLSEDLGLEMRTMTIDNREDNLGENVGRIATAVRDRWTDNKHATNPSETFAGHGLWSRN